MEKVKIGLLLLSHCMYMYFDKRFAEIPLSSPLRKAKFENIPKSDAIGGIKLKLCRR